MPGSRVSLCSTQIESSLRPRPAMRYVKKLKKIIRQLYDFYDNSAIRTAGLVAVQKLLDQPELKVLQPSSTRWLSTGNCVVRRKKILGSIISLSRESEERGDATAAGLYEFLSEYQFIATLLLFCDTLPTINHLTKDISGQRHGLCSPGNCHRFHKEHSLEITRVTR